MEEEICSDDIILRAIDYSESGRFEERIDDFKDKYRHLFNEQINNEDNRSGGEQSLGLYEAFLAYQDLIEALFEDFILDNRISRDRFFNSFRAVASGQFTPIFGVHHQQWFLDMLTGWSEYEEFVRLMCADTLRRRSHK